MSCLQIHTRFCSLLHHFATRLFLRSKANDIFSKSKSSRAKFPTETAFYQTILSNDMVDFLPILHCYFRLIISKACLCYVIIGYYFYLPLFILLHACYLAAFSCHGLFWSLILRHRCFFMLAGSYRICWLFVLLLNSHILISPMLALWSLFTVKPRYIVVFTSSLECYLWLLKIC